MMRSANPALSDKVFQNLPASTAQRMTVRGTVDKSLILIALVMTSAFFSWQSAYEGGWSEGTVPSIPGWYIPVILASLATTIVLIFKRTWAPFLAPLYAVMQGAALGAISSIFEARYPGIVMQAVFCTMGTFIALLMAYRSGLIQATENFKLGVIAATGGIAIVYLLDFALMFFGIRMPFIHENGPIGILVSVVITVVAALNLVLDFDFIEKGAEHGAPKYMEWYSAFGLLVTLIWLYLEMLRLLGKGRSR